jgi:hypothetical protein
MQDSCLLRVPKIRKVWRKYAESPQQMLSGMTTGVAREWIRMKNLGNP